MMSSQRADLRYYFFFVCRGDDKEQSKLLMKQKQTEKKNITIKHSDHVYVGWEFPITAFVLW